MHHRVKFLIWPALPRGRYGPRIVSDHDPGRLTPPRVGSYKTFPAGECPTTNRVLMKRIRFAAFPECYRNLLCTLSVDVAPNF